MNNVPRSRDYWYGVRILELLAARLWVVVRDRGATRRGGSMILTVFAGTAEFERSLIHQRTSSGRQAAKKRGDRFGRPPKLTADQVALGHRHVDEGTSVRDAAALLKCHHATLYRALQPQSGPTE
jgi:DNA invertase Pin-like site-specific DNA recombinase